MNTTIEHGPELFRFRNERQWVNRAKEWFQSAGIRGTDAICIDANGRICTRGEHFMRATRENTYPIIVYRMEVKL